jgi:hypothetical protein
MSVKVQRLPRGANAQVEYNQASLRKPYGFLSMFFLQLGAPPH